MYLLLVKISPGQTGDAARAFKNLPGKPSKGVTLYCTYNVFGAWDICVWFEADNHDNAGNFVQKIHTIPGVIGTCIMPTTTIKEYKRERARIVHERRLSPQFVRDMQKFNDIKEELLRDIKYRGKFVAVYKGELIGPKDSEEELNKIINEKYGNVSAYIAKVAEEEVVEFSSPELM